MKQPTELELYTFLSNAYEEIGFADMARDEEFDSGFAADQEILRQIEILKQLYINANK